MSVVPEHTASLQFPEDLEWGSHEVTPGAGAVLIGRVQDWWTQVRVTVDAAVEIVRLSRAEYGAPSSDVETDEETVSGHLVEPPSGDQLLAEKRAAAERERLTTRKDEVIARVAASQRRLGWLVCSMAETHPMLLEGVVDTVERARITQAGISDRQILKVYAEDFLTERTSVQREKWLGFCMMWALMDGKPDGYLPF